jgi:HSP20 family protein
MSNLLQTAPFTPFERLSTLMEDMFPASALVKSVWNPAVDIKETDIEYAFTAELPGMNREDLEVEFVGDTLVIRGKREETKEEKGEGFIRKERHSGSFYRSFRIDTPIKQDAIRAEYKDGLLTVAVPKAEPVKTQRISVK